MRPTYPLILSIVVAAGIATAGAALPGDRSDGIKYYRIVDGEADARTYNGFRRYHAACNHCHGPDGMGSTFVPPLIERLPDAETFRQIVRLGTGAPPLVMKGFADDPNIAPYLDDIYAYLQARADGVLPRGRPMKGER